METVPILSLALTQTSYFTAAAGVILTLVFALKSCTVLHFEALAFLYRTEYVYPPEPFLADAVTVTELLSFIEVAEIVDVFSTDGLTVNLA